MTQVLVAAGSNVEPLAHLRRALDALLPRYPRLRRSTAYRNRAVGFEGEDFVNLVIRFDTDDDVHAVIERVADAYAGHDQDRLDGLTVDLGDWWFNLRPSNTEPLLRLNLEAATADDVARRVDQVRSAF